MKERVLEIHCDMFHQRNALSIAHVKNSKLVDAMQLFLKVCSVLSKVVFNLYHLCVNAYMQPSWSCVALSHG
jgi:hypothetical protein